MPNHSYNFEGAEDLTTMGSSWFISYLYHDRIDGNHRNWSRVARTLSTRTSAYNRSIQHHRTFLAHILQMNPTYLSRNTIGLTGEEVIKLAREIYSNWSV